MFPRRDNMLVVEAAHSTIPTAPPTGAVPESTRVLGREIHPEYAEDHEGPVEERRLSQVNR